MFGLLTHLRCSANTKVFGGLASLALTSFGESNWKLTLVQSLSCQVSSFFRRETIPGCGKEDITPVSDVSSRTVAPSLSSWLLKLRRR